MSSIEGTASQSSSSPPQSAQLRDEEYDDGRRRASLSDKPIDNLSEDYISDRSLNASFQTKSSDPGEGHDEQLSVAEEASTSIKKSPLSRPNKYHGPVSTWRDRTAPERQIAASLDQLRAKDLGVQLYNFYALKRHENKLGKRQENDENEESKVSSFSRNWVSSKSWTAWPMVPELVARELDANSWETDVDQEAATQRRRLSSQEVLQELLAALACRKAKERFNQRKWEDSDNDSPTMPSDQWSTSQARIFEMTDDWSGTEGGEPTVLADDQRAKSILQPSLNHILGKLDTLLIGLHHARSSYATHKKSSLKHHGTIDDESSRDNKRKRTMPRSERIRDRNWHPTVSPEIPGALSATDDELDQARGRRPGSGFRAAKRPSKSKPRLDRIGLRDWSDILGVASMCGWDPGVVARAAARCSDLFDQAIMLRTLHEGHPDYQESTFLPKTLGIKDFKGLRVTAKEEESKNSATCTSGSLYGSGGQFSQPPLYEGGDEEGKDARIGGVHVDGFLQLIPKHESWTRKCRAPRKK
ncbi:MAG: hypothetical protein Q9225_006225 [Loekoesia sp. 1 TL-2023]